MPLYSGPVLMEYDERFQVPYVKGVNPEVAKEQFDLRELIVDGDYHLDWDQALVGIDIARQSGIGVGDFITVTGPSALRPAEEIFLPRDLEVVGVFQVEGIVGR